MLYLYKDMSSSILLINPWKIFSNLYIERVKETLQDIP